MADADRVVEIEASAPAGTPVWLVVPADGGTCAIASGAAAERGVSVGPIGAARAAWLGEKVQVSLAAVPACDGLPPVENLLVPPHGAAVGVRSPVLATDATGPFALTSIGGGWWEVRPTGTGQGAVVFRHANDPPTAFLVATDPNAPSPLGSNVRLPVGGATVRPGASFVDLGADPPVTVRTFGGSTVLLAARAGSADGLWRVGDAAPEPLHVEVSGPLPAGTDALVVPVGGHRIRRPDRPVSDVVVADPAVARVTLAGTRLRVDGLQPGRTTVALASEDGVHLLVIAVGS